MPHKYDVIIIGGGLAGASAASVLGRKGIKALLIDQRSKYPACFKAEKIERSHADLFRKLGLLDTFLTGEKPEIWTFYGKKLLKKSRIEQYGYTYQDMVNEVRDHMPSNIDVKIARVDEIETGDKTQKVVLNDGSVLETRLLILATGTSNNLFEKLDIGKKILSESHSLCFGFTVKPDDQPEFDFEAITYHFENPNTRIGYITFFKIGNSMRINLFTYWNLKDPHVREFKQDPCGELQKHLPGLSKHTGKMKLVGKVEMVPVNLYKAQNYMKAGLVLVGDAFQSVCPTTGTGLDKVLTDVDVLCHECIPFWLKTDGMDIQKISQFYQNDRKIENDRDSLHAAFDQKKRITATSLSAKINRNIYVLKAKRSLRHSKMLKLLRPVYSTLKTGR